MIWESSPLGKTSNISARLEELSKPKNIAADYKEDRYDQVHVLLFSSFKSSNDVIFILVDLLIIAIIRLL